MTIDLPSLSTLGQVVGTLLMSYGPVREVLDYLAQRRPYGKGRYGEGPFGGEPSENDSRLVNAGVRMGLFPEDRQLTLQDRKTSGKVFLLGLVLVLASTLVEL